MPKILFILSGIAFFIGFAILVSAESAVHEIEAFVLFIIGAIFFTGAAIFCALKSIEEKIGTSILQTMPSNNTVEPSTHSETTPLAEKTPTTESDLDSEITKHEGPEQKEKPSIIALDNDPKRPYISKAQCGSCDKVMTYPKRLSAKRVRCPECQEVVVLP